MEGVLQFPIGQIYMLICKQGEQAIRLDNLTDPHNSRVVGAAPNPQDVAQLWFVDRIKNDDYEIVNLLSGYCFDEESHEIHLKQGKQNSDQLFWIEKAPVSAFHQYYWIKTAKGSNQAVSLEGILRYKEYNVNDEAQLFRFEVVNNNNFLNNTNLLINVRSGKALDVPAGNKKAGERIVQWKKNNRINQRWNLVRAGNSFVIESAHSRLVLDIAGEAKKPGSKVVQWTRTGGSNQLWNFERQGNGNYVIRSVHEPSLVLGIDGDDVNDGDKLAIVNHDTQWRIEGPGPR